MAKLFKPNFILFHIFYGLTQLKLSALLGFSKYITLVKKVPFCIIHLPLQVTNNDIYLGEKTKDCLDKLKSHVKAEVCNNIKAFFETAVDYVLKKFPMDSPMLTHAQVANVELRTTTSWASLDYFLSRVPNDFSLDVLHDAFRRYQTFSLPIEVTNIRNDEVWHQLKNWRDVDGAYPFQELASIMLAILTIPHSNADSERIFSVVRKNRTETRSSMSVETLESLLVNKLGGRVMLTGDILSKCKSATSQSLRSNK